MSKHLTDVAQTTYCRITSDQLTYGDVYTLTTKYKVEINSTPTEQKRGLNAAL
jgi:hypothetical protein